MRYYPQSKIDELISRGSIKRELDRDGNEHLVLIVNLPEPGGAIIKEVVRSLESATVGDWINDPTNPYLRAAFPSMIDPIGNFPSFRRIYGRK